MRPYISDTSVYRHDREKYEDVEIPIIKHSPFYGESKFADLIGHNADLSILDLNIQNVYSKWITYKRLCENFNINLLSINSNSHFADFFDSVITS